LDGRSARRKAATYIERKQNERRHPCHDPSVRAGEDGSSPRPRGHCDRHWLGLGSPNSGETVGLMLLISAVNNRSFQYVIKVNNELKDSQERTRFQLVYGGGSMKSGGRHETCAESEQTRGGAKQ
jgi:hypothetical protein